MVQPYFISFLVQSKHRDSSRGLTDAIVERISRGVIVFVVPLRTAKATWELGLMAVAPVPKRPPGAECKQGKIKGEKFEDLAK